MILSGVRSTALNGVRHSKVAPRGYQLEGIQFLSLHERALLRDDVGLGKTIQAAKAAVPPCLILVPNILVEQWYDWLRGEDENSRRINGGVVIPNVEGIVMQARGNFYQKYETLQALNQGVAQWVVGNHQMLFTHVDWFEAVAHDPPWTTMIVDESHHLRNHAGKMARTAVKLAMGTQRVYLLTATPIWKEPDDLFMQFRLLQPDIFTSYTQFVKLFCIADMTRFGPRIYGVKKEMQDELREMLDMVSLGRTYEQAGREVPPVIRNVVKCEFPPELRRMYDELESMYKSELLGETVQVTSMMEMYNRLRQMTAYPGKIEVVQELIEQATTGHQSLENGRKPGRVVVFSWFSDHAERAASMLGGVALTGKISAEERRRQALDKNNRILCINLAALSEGVDLSDVRTVFFIEEHWPPGSEHQALGRIQRERLTEDNSEPIKVHYVHIKNSIDEAIHAVSQRREATLRDVLNTRFSL